MPKLIRRITRFEVPSINFCVCNPTFSNGIMTYRDGRPERYRDFSRTLWTCSFERSDAAPKGDLSDFQLITPPENWIISDARIFFFKDEHWISLNLVQSYNNSHGYISKMYLYNIKIKQFIPIDFSGISDIEKNYCYFSYNDTLYFTRNIWRGRQEIYSINPHTGHATLAYDSPYFSQYNEDRFGLLKHSSHAALDGDTFWTLIHSHTEGINPKYKAGICAFFATPPFKMLDLSQVALMDLETATIIYPVSLTIENDIFFMGIALPTYDAMDIISFTRAEITEHFKYGVTFPYPAEVPHMQESHCLRYGPITRVNDSGWSRLWGDWGQVKEATSDNMPGPGWAYFCLRRILLPGRYSYKLTALCIGGNEPILSAGFCDTKASINPGDLTQAQRFGKVFNNASNPQTLEGEILVVNEEEFGFWSYYYGNGYFRIVDAKFMRIDF